jgi:hypothetical protein
MTKRTVAMNVLLAFGVCLFAVALALLLTPNVSSADIFEWVTTTEPSPCACVLTGD